MSKPTSAVKNRYNEKAYDRINVVIPKGQKAVIQAFAASCGVTTNAFIQRAITEAMAKNNCPD